jgi:flavin reductase (DIM6/NTAB) family NADH-FMN oxidoreductase RutF
MTPSSLARLLQPAGYNLTEMKGNIPARAAIRPTADQLRNALRFWTTGVTIVSVSYQGVVHGMTVNSFTSLSLEPPLVMISLEKVTRTHGLVASAGSFGVSILSQEQRELSDRFAGRESETSDRFDGVETFTMESASPLLSQALAFFDCRVSATYDAGTHTLFVGEVLATGLPGENSKQPLAYFNRNYRRLVDL